MFRPVALFRPNPSAQSQPASGGTPRWAQRIFPGLLQTGILEPRHPAAVMPFNPSAKDMWLSVREIGLLHWVALLPDRKLGHL
jgi:hypothetical protein